MGRKVTERFVIIALLIIVMLVSFFPLGNKMTKVETYKNQIEYLDKKSGDALKLTAFAATTSTVISLIPGDAGLPIAEELMDITSYFGIALAALVLEKYLLTLIGSLVFKVIIPLACILGIISILRQNSSLKSLAKKIVIFGIMVLLLVPTSVKASQIIEEVQGFTITDVEQEVNTLSEEGIAKEPESITDENQELYVQEKNDEKQSLFGEVKSWFIKTADKTVDVVTTVAKNVGTAVASGTSHLINKAQCIFSGLLEKLAILIVTSCIIPILVIIVFAFFAKALLGIDFTDSLKKINSKRHDIAKGYVKSVHKFTEPDEYEGEAYFHE